MEGTLLSARKGFLDSSLRSSLGMTVRKKEFILGSSSVGGIVWNDRLGA